MDSRGSGHCTQHEAALIDGGNIEGIGGKSILGMSSRFFETSE